MSRINLKIGGALTVSPIVTVNDERVKLKRNKYGNYECSFDAAEGTNLKIFTWDIISSPLWLLWEIIFFIISVFGIFDWGRGKYLSDMKCEAILHPRGDSDMKVSLMRPSSDGAPAVMFESSAGQEILENEYINHTKIKKRRRIVRLVRVLGWLAVIASAIAIVVSIFS